MQIKYLGSDKFEIKSKDVEVRLEDKVTVNGFEFPGPGEYEKSGVILSGIDDGENVIYVLSLEEINLCYLGKINHVLSEESAKQIGDVDILFLPLGEKNSADVKTATKIISAVDPKIVIPMLYANLDEFKKTEGMVDGEVDILKIKKADLPQDEREIFILNPAN